MSPFNPNPAKAGRQFGVPVGNASLVAKLIEVWFRGLRVFGRFLWFSFFFIVLMAPFNMTADHFYPGDKSLFGGDGLNFPGVVLLTALGVYLPFAAYFSARWSHQLLGTESRNNSGKQSGAISSNGPVAP